MSAKRTALAALLAVFELRRLHGLPLHVGWRVGAACTQRLDVVDDVSRAAPAVVAIGRAGMVPLE